MNTIELLEYRLDLETSRRMLAEDRLAAREELDALREEKIAAKEAETEKLRALANAEYYKYQGERYRAADDIRDEYKERMDRAHEKLCERQTTIEQLKAALALKDKELCELKGGCK